MTLGATTPGFVEPPMCAKCQKPVERMRSWLDPMSARFWFSFHCHGDTERAVLEDELVEDAQRIRMVECFRGDVRGALTP